MLPNPGSTEHFFKEHQWGAGTTRRGRVLQYEVRHPHWDILPIQESQIDINFKVLYGDEWGFLNQAEPISKVCAVGSPIEVFQPTLLN